MSAKKENSVWSRTFRAIVLDNENLEKIKTLKFRMMHVVLFSITSILLVAVLTASLISFTPLRYWVPGYADITENKVYVKLLREVNNLEQESEENSQYIEKVQNLLSGNHSDDSESFMGEEESTRKNKIVERIEEDEELRKKVSAPDNRGLGLPRVVNNSKSNPEMLRQRTLVSPLKGVISAHFQTSKEHYGVDILAPALSPIMSVDDGIVISADWTMETGYTIGIQHDDNLISYYKHNSALLKKTGQSVMAGEAIAIIGNTGHLTSGPHLHFELWYNGQSLDPSQFISFED